MDLTDNLLYGDIPFSISKLKRLELLNLKNNQLTEPASFTVKKNNTCCWYDMNWLMLLKSDLMEKESSTKEIEQVKSLIQLKE